MLAVFAHSKRLPKNNINQPMSDICIFYNLIFWGVATVRNKYLKDNMFFYIVHKVWYEKRKKLLI